MCLKLSKLFPDALIEITYEETGMQFAGKTTFKNGEIVNEDEYKFVNLVCTKCEEYNFYIDGKEDAEIPTECDYCGEELKEEE